MAPGTDSINVLAETGTGAHDTGDVYVSGRNAEERHGAETGTAWISRRGHVYVESEHWLLLEGSGIVVLLLQADALRLRSTQIWVRSRRL